MIHFTKAKATPPKPKKPKGGKKATLNKLKNFLYQAEPEAVEILVSNFNAQQNAVTYKELREAYLAGGITQKQFEKWQKDYSQLITVSLAPKWEAAAAAAAQEVKNKYPYFVYEPSVSAGMDFIKQHGAELVTNLAQEQRQALNAVIQHVSGYTNISPDEAARIIRPCIGLTKPQALANTRYREAVKQAYIKAHPHGKLETADKRAADAAARYAARQHRYRAQNIARTELAYAYNAGAYLPLFLRSFLCPQHPHVLNVYFGVPGSGKTTFAAYLTRWALHENVIIRFCRRHQNPVTRALLNSRYLKRRIDVYSNVPITGAYVLNAREDIGHYMIEDAKVIIDEAGIEYNNRNFKSFPQEAVYFYKYHRHYRVSVDVFSQSYEDMDVTLRRLAQNFYVVRRSLVPFCVVARRIRRRVGVDEHTKQIADLYALGLPVLDTKRIFSPPLWKMFNSYSRRELPRKEWSVW